MTTFLANTESNRATIDSLYFRLAREAVAAILNGNISDVKNVIKECEDPFEAALLSVLIMELLPKSDQPIFHRLMRENLP